MTDYNREQIAEARAGLRVSTHFKALPQETKMAELFAERRLRASMTTCALADLVEEFLKTTETPLVEIEQAQSQNLKRAQNAVASRNRRLELSDLKKRRAQLNDEIRKLERKRKTG